MKAKKIISTVMVSTMCVTSLPLSVLADEVKNVTEIGDGNLKKEGLKDENSSVNQATSNLDNVKGQDDVSKKEGNTYTKQDEVVKTDEKKSETVIENKVVAKHNVIRVGGKNRYETSIKIAGLFNKSNEIIFAGGSKTFADALSAISLSEGKRPIVLIKDRTSDDVSKMLNLSGYNKFFFLGAGMIENAKVLEKTAIGKADAKGNKVVVFAGVDRYETNVRANEYINSKVDKDSKTKVIARDTAVVSGEMYPDALAGSYLYHKGFKDILLTKKNALPTITEGYVKNSSLKKAVIVGGRSTVSDNVLKDLENYTNDKVNRINGDNRYLTALQIAKQDENFRDVIIASGENFADALSASALSQYKHAPILLTKKGKLEEGVREFILAKRGQIDNVYVIGAQGSVSDEVKTDIEELLKGNLRDIKPDPKPSKPTNDNAVVTPINTLPKSKVINTPYISQLYPVYAPVGCEPTSLLMGLKAKGYAKNVGLREFLDKMPKHSSNPKKGYVGSPYRPSETLRTTINPKPLSEYGKKYGDVFSMEGASMEEVKKQVLQGNPVVIYVTLYWRPAYFRNFNIEGKSTRYLRNNHVILVDGYDSKTDSFHISDPYNNSNRKQPLKYWKKRSVVEPLYNIRKFAVGIR